MCVADPPVGIAKHTSACLHPIKNNIIKKEEIAFLSGFFCLQNGRLHQSSGYKMRDETLECLTS